MSAQSYEEATGAVEVPRKWSFKEFNEGSEVLELGVSALLEDVGVLQLLEGYLINVPPTATFISYSEFSSVAHASRLMNADAGVEGEVRVSFETRVLQSARAAASSLSKVGGSQVLHEAFFEALEECGRKSRWPDVELFVMDDGRGYDVLPEIVETSFGLSYFEYLQLRHQCARQAATYPSLDVAVRDELLGPQREHYARTVLDGLAILPQVKEVPARYRGEMDELLAEGW